MSNKFDVKELLTFANSLADKSEKILNKYFRSNLDIEKKSDNSPVTIADKKCEELIRETIKKYYPSHNVIGEELENENNDKEFTWVIDPIDGTRSFIAGHKDFGTLIALLHNSKPILGIINCPAHNERWIGIKNQPTTLNGNIVKTSKTKKLSESYLCTTGIYFDDKTFRADFDKIIEKTKYYRFGGDCYMYGMLATGLIDIVIEDQLKIWDYMALVPVIEGAGGCITDKFNNKITINSDGSLIATANSEFHQEIFKALRD
tara:strand:- start:277 stop:1059 length:783 start_codon:yes stop_codon:yes gene_type:complete